MNKRSVIQNAVKGGSIYFASYWISLFRVLTLGRENYKYAYCGYYSEKYQVVDHIDGDPENHSDNNLQVICQMCNCVKHAGQGCVLKGVVDLYRNSKFSQNSIIIITRFMRDTGKSDEEIKKFLGLDEPVPFKMNSQYLNPLFAFVTSRNTSRGSDMYDGWKKYHESFLKQQYEEKYIETRLQTVSSDQYSTLQAKAKTKY